MGGMFVTADLCEGIEDVLDPKHRVVHFGESPAQRIVTYILRRAWTAKAPEEAVQKLGVEAAFEAWVQRNKASLEKDADEDGLEQNPDKENVESEWRRHLLQMYNHLFHDIGGMLPDVNCRLGHFHAPNHTSWVMSYPADESSGSYAAVQRWDQNILILPAFLDKGVGVRASRVVEREAEMAAEGEVTGSLQEVVSVEMGSFCGYQTMAWFIRRGMDVKFELVVEAGGEDGVEEKKRTGVAAVFAIGILCTDSHGQPCCNHEL